MRLASFANKLVTVLMLWLCLASVANASNSIDSVRVWPAPENTRIVFDLSQKADKSRSQSKKNSHQYG